MTTDQFPPHKGALFLTHNEHSSYYEPIERWIADHPDYAWLNDESKQRSVDTGEVWVLQWYPNTPVGFHIVAAPTLDEVLALATGQNIGAP